MGRRSRRVHSTGGLRHYVKMMRFAQNAIVKDTGALQKTCPVLMCWQCSTYLGTIGVVAVGVELCSRVDALQ